MLNSLHEIIITCHICQCIAVLLVIAVDQASVDCVDPLQAMSSEISDVLSSASAEQPADHSADGSAERPAHHRYDVESTMASVATQNQLAVLQCLDREGWLVAPLVNGCRVAVLSRTCRQAVEGWPSRLKCLEFESGAGEVARKLQWVAHHCPKLQYLLFKDSNGNSVDVEIPLSQKMESLFLTAWRRRRLALTRLRRDGWAVSDATYKLDDDDMRTLSQLRSPEPRILIVCAMGRGT